MCLVLGVIGDHQIGIASERALENILPLKLVEAADELPGAVNAQRPLVVVASHRDRFGDPVVAHLAEVRQVLPQIGIVLISDIGATTANGFPDLSMLGEIRSVKARSRDYPTNLQHAVEEQAERYRVEYILRAFTPHTPPNLQPLLHFCARTWDTKLSADDVAAALKKDRHTITKRVSAAQPACTLRDMLRMHHFLDITWRLCARRDPFKAMAQRFRYRRAARLRAGFRHWLGIDLRELALGGVRGWESLVDRCVDEFIGRRRTRAPGDEPVQR